MFSNANVEVIVDALFEEINRKVGELPKEIKSLENKLVQVGENIDKLIDMSLQTSFNETIMKNIELLEVEKSDSRSKIEYHKVELGKVFIPPREAVIQKLKNDMDIKNKSPEDQKRIIETYVEKVLIFSDHIDIYSDCGLSASHVNSGYHLILR